MVVLRGGVGAVSDERGTPARGRNAPFAAEGVALLGLLEDRHLAAPGGGLILRERKRERERERERERDSERRERVCVCV